MSSAAREHRQIVTRLARLHGVQPSFIDASGVRRTASVESLARILEALGSPASTLALAERSLEARLAAMVAERLAPVTVAWEGRRASVELRLARGASGPGKTVCTLTLESGERVEWIPESKKSWITRRAAADGRPLSSIKIALPKGLPAGYHRLKVVSQGEKLETLVICAPVKAYRPPAERVRGEWGLFCPIYALRPADSSRDWGCGGLRELGELATWSRSLGGGVVATLPLLPAHLKEPFDPSPYAPVSREYWNWLFADPLSAPEAASCPDATALVSSAEFKREAQELARLELIDYKRASTLKRRVIELLADRFFGSGGEKSAEFKSFLAAHPRAEAFARFCAATEKQGAPWEEWPARMRRGTLRDGDYDAAACRFHLYAQYLVTRQMESMSRELKARGGLVYLDLPVGTSPYGFDVWSNPSLFAMGCATGAPPDPYFTGGQNWGFPPMHPEEARREGYATFIRALRHHMGLADYLRLDHVMAFHRLFWIPDGMDASGGAYIGYHAEDFYAILCLESHRHRCRLVGENLGTVPPAVNKALAKHDLCGLYVAQYEMQPAPKQSLRPVPANCVASVNTHDMPPFATSWAGGDVDDRIRLGMLDPWARERELAVRAKMRDAMIKQFRAGPGATAASMRDALIDFLGASRADFVLVNIEDLWLETKWQNVPGTMEEHPNWRRRLRLDLGAIASDPAINAILRRLDRIRKGGSAGIPAPRGARGARASSGQARTKRHAVGQGA